VGRVYDRQGGEEVEARQVRHDPARKMGEHLLLGLPVRPRSAPVIGENGCFRSQSQARGPRDSASDSCHVVPSWRAQHLGDLWDKKLPGMSDEKWSVSDPGKHGFDDWMTTQAEASNSMTNCGARWKTAASEILVQFPPVCPELVLENHGFSYEDSSKARHLSAGCFHKNHSNPGRKPNGGYNDIVPLGDHCVVGR
jgi:hypothetical protein